jgi:hypothetical protein
LSRYRRIDRELENAVRVELEAIAFRDGLKAK